MKRSDSEDSAPPTPLPQIEALIAIWRQRALTGLAEGQDGLTSQLSAVQQRVFRWCADELAAALVPPDPPSAAVPNLKACCAPAPDRSGRSCDKPRGHEGDHWTYGGNTKTWAMEWCERCGTTREAHNADICSAPRWTKTDPNLMPTPVPAPIVSTVACPECDMPAGVWCLKDHESGRHLPWEHSHAARFHRAVSESLPEACKVCGARWSCEHISVVPPSPNKGHIDPDCEVARGVGWMCTCQTPEEKAENARERAECEAERDADARSNLPVDAAFDSALRFLREGLKRLKHTEAVADCWHCNLGYVLGVLDTQRAITKAFGGDVPPDPPSDVAAHPQPDAPQRAKP